MRKQQDEANERITEGVRAVIFAVLLGFGIVVSLTALIILWRLYWNGYVSLSDAGIIVAGIVVLSVSVEYAINKVRHN